MADPNCFHPYHSLSEEIYLHPAVYSASQTSATATCQDNAQLSDATSRLIYTPAYCSTGATVTATAPITAAVASTTTHGAALASQLANPMIDATSGGSQVGYNQVVGISPTNMHVPSNVAGLPSTALPVDALPAVQPAAIGQPVTTRTAVVHPMKMSPTAPAAPDISGSSGLSVGSTAPAYADDGSSLLTHATSTQTQFHNTQSASFNSSTLDYYHTENLGPYNPAYPYQHASVFMPNGDHVVQQHMWSTNPSTISSTSDYPNEAPAAELNTPAPVDETWMPYESSSNDLGSSPTVARALAAAQNQKRPRSEKKPIPSEQKDNKYFERRKRNNQAAKKSRDARKAREDDIAIRASFLEKENAILRAQTATLREEAHSLKQLLMAKTRQRQ